MDHLKVRGNMYYEEAMHRFQIFYQSKYLLIRFFQEHFQVSLCMSVFCLATKELHFSVKASHLEETIMKVKRP